MDNTLKQSKEDNKILFFVGDRDEFKQGIFKSPKLLDHFMMNRERKIVIQPEKYLYLKRRVTERGCEVDFDLNKGIEDYDHRPANEGLSSILQYIFWKSNQIGSNDLHKIINYANVVSCRGNITKIASLPYEKGGGEWKCLIEKFENVLFLREIDTDERVEKENKSEWINKCNYWGYKFETYLLAEKEKDPTPNERVSKWEDMRAVFSMIIPSNSIENEVKLFYGAEIDGFDSNDKIVEVKTQAYKLFNGKYFESKAMKWWLQSTLVGINHIIVGFRTNNGKVFKLQKVNLQKLQKSCNEWNGNVCFNTFQQIMNVIRDKYDQLVKPNELLLIEKKRDKQIIEYSVVLKDDYPEKVLTNEFKNQFKTSSNPEKTTDNHESKKDKKNIDDILLQRFVNDLKLK